MKKPIEVEIRGKLNKTEYARVKSFLDKQGIHKGSQERDMFLLLGYPGYSKDFVGREVDIRLRNTDGVCEIMLKRKVKNAREEVSLELKDRNLEAAKKIVKALGYTTAIWMHRLKEIYKYRGIEWSLVVAPANIRYYEAELAVKSSKDVLPAHRRLEMEVKKLGLSVLNDAGTRALIYQLDTKANKLVKL